MPAEGTNVQNASPGESLASMLAVERRRDGEFVARLENFWGSSIGGDALARAALAAADTCAGKELHSLHACFLRSAPPAVPLTLRVDRLEDGDRLARREVRLCDDGLLCQVVASFVSPGDGLGYQDVTLDPGLPAPQDLPTTLEQARAEGWADYARGPIEFRRVTPTVWPDPSWGVSGTHVEWVRPRAPLPADPRVHMAALVFLSGFYSHWSFAQRVGKKFAHDRFMTLDHALWVHRLPGWDDWWLLKATTEVGHAGRALSRREVYTQDGVLVASIAQEALVGEA